MDLSGSGKLRGFFKNKKLVALVAAVVVIAGGVLGYVHYRHSPRYTISLIQDSIKNHDWDTFSRHVDMDTLSSSSYDELTSFALDNDEDLADDDSTKGFVNGIVTAMKPNVVSAWKDAARDYVKTGELKVPDSSGNKDKDEDGAKEEADSIEKKSGVDQMTFQGITDVTDKENNVAVVGMKFHNKQLDHDFVINLKMNQLQDGTWEIVSVDNLKDYLAEMKKVYTAKLDEVNKPIQEKIDAVIQITDIHAAIEPADPFGISKRIAFRGKETVNSTQPITHLEGILTVTDSKGKDHKEPYKLDAAGTGDFAVGEDIFGFGRGKVWENMDLNSAKISNKTTKIKYADGTELALKTTLDD